MKRMIQPLGRMGSRLRRSVASIRRGSVLIFVVVLLVLLALIGTAFISTARTDRYATQQNAYNTQIDLLAQGVQNMIASSAAGSLFGTNSAYRPAGDANYRSYTDYKFDTWLAERIPTLITDSSGPISPTPGWTSLTIPLTGALQFDDPYTGIPTPLVGTKDNIYGAIHYLTLADGTNVPAMRLVDKTGTQLPNPNTGAPANGIFHAADADGDGIADSGYFKLPIGQINGATWYAAVRIIDDNSAINVNTAWASSGDFDFGGTASTNLGFFRSNTGLLELLRDYNPAGAYATFSPEWNALNAWRFNGAVYASQPPVDDTTPNGLVRGDYNFISQGDALENQIARRLDWPGYQVVGTRYQVSSYSDMLSLARNFVLRSDSNSALENLLASSLIYYYQDTAPVGEQYLRTQPYPAYSYYSTASPYAGFWFNDNFDYASEVAGNKNTIKNLRALLVTRNPVSGLMPQQSMTVLPAEVKTPVAYPPSSYDLMPDFTTANLPEPRTSINTAQFGELWRGFWSVMQDSSHKNGSGQSVLSTPFGTPEVATTPASSLLPTDMYTGSKFDAAFNPPTPQTINDIHPYHMFRNSLRDPTAGGTGNTFFTPANEMLLRAALASINTIALREPTDKTTATHDVIPSRDIVLRATVGGTANSLVTVRVYGSKIQPFITEIYAQTDVVANPTGVGPNPIGYVAVELFNPYSWPIDLKADGYKLTTLTRNPGALAPTQALVVDFSAAAGTFIVPAGGYLLLENYNQAGGGTALYRPLSSGLPATGPLPVRNVGQPALNEAYVAGLEIVLNHEMVLVRPQDPATPPALLADNVPCDSFDFTGLFPGTTTLATAWHYARANDGTNTWKFVYPGRYDGGVASQRQQGTQAAAVWDPSTAGVDPWETAPPAPGMTLGATAGVATSNDNAAASYPTTFTIQIQNQGSPGPNPLSVATNSFPFGGFARNGDILQVPYIGAYRVTDSSGTLIELNSITMDASFAEDADTSDDSAEQVGRFCPGLVTAPVTDNYAWASDLVDFLTAIQNPHDDYMPNVDPNRYNTITGKTAPSATPNGSVTTMAQANGGREDIEPIQGLININTASWKVLSALPLVLNAGTGQVDRANIIQLAKDIVTYRQTNGPFQSIFDLNKVTNFQSGMGSIIGNPGNLQGDLTPVGSTDNVVDDFENKYLTLTRISNLVTTRSDAFTCYVLLQGWQNVGTVNAKVVAERRFAFIVDRSGVTPTNPSANVIPVPSN